MEVQVKAITFAIAVNKRDVLQQNLLASPCFQAPHPHQILIQEGFKSAASAYNDAIDKSVNDIIVFCHQDIFFPEAWFSQLEEALQYLNAKDPQWGVLGCSGTTREGLYFGHVYSAGVGIVGEASTPVAVQTLDEIVLILRKSSGLRFDDTLPHFHLYGADICLRAEQYGMHSYAISAFCFHNTAQAYILPKEFYECCTHVRQTWKKSLPIQTTCIRISRSSLPIYFRRFRELREKYLRRRQMKETRVADVREAYKELSARISAQKAIGELE